MTGTGREDEGKEGDTENLKGLQGQPAEQQKVKQESKDSTPCTKKYQQRLGILNRDEQRIKNMRPTQKKPALLDRLNMSIYLTFCFQQR